MARLGRLGLSLYIAASVACLLALYLPWPDVLTLIPTLIEYMPGWLLVLPACLLAPFITSRRSRLLLCAITAVNVGVFLEFELPSPFGRDDDGLRIRIASYNIGNGKITPKALLSWYESVNLDALLLQETQAFTPGKSFDNGWNYACGGRLCILTQHDVETLEALSRRDFKGGWGSYVARFNLSIAGEVIAVYNVHLNTPRHELEYLRGFVEGAKKAAGLYASRRLESQLASQMVKQHPDQRVHSIIAGDFNLSQRSAIYRNYWSDYTNAFRRAGMGMGYTKKTRLFGARIDHVLVNDGLQIRSATVGKDLGGDHNPLITELILR